MSRLGDVLIELGPLTQDYVVSPGLSSDMRWVRAIELNALRDELIELRRVSAICVCGCEPGEHVQGGSTRCCSCDCWGYTPRGHQRGADTGSNPSGGEPS